MARTASAMTVAALTPRMARRSSAVVSGSSTGRTATRCPSTHSIAWATCVGVTKLTPADQARTLPS